jgi:hypothetical protein
LAPLPNAHRPVLQVQVVDVEGGGLADPQAGRVQGLEQGLVAHGQLVVTGDRAQQRLHLLDRERLGQAGRDLGGAEVAGRVGAGQPLPDQEAVEAAHRGQ